MSNHFIWAEPNPIDTEVDVRQQVKDILDKRGHYAFLRKARKTLSPSFGRHEASDNDPFNHGVGHLYDDYLIKIRKRPVVEMTSGPMREIRTEIGFVAPRRYIVYTTHPVVDAFPTLVPTVNDCIIEVTLDEATGMPKLAYNIERVYDIESTHEYRDKGGRIEYWSLLVFQSVLGK